MAQQKKGLSEETKRTFGQFNRIQPSSINVTQWKHPQFALHKCYPCIHQGLICLGYWMSGNDLCIDTNINNGRPFVQPFQCKICDI